MSQANTVFWSGRTEKNRIAALQEIERCIADYGYIEDFHLFSDLAIGMSVIIAGNKTDDLYMSLAKYLHMEKPEDFHMEDEGEIKIMLHVDFSAGSGELKNEVPDVPG